jgi:hypothetical protein
MEEAAQAENLCKRALAASEGFFGPNHENTLIAKHNLAVAYFDQGEYERAQHLYREVSKEEEEKKKKGRGRGRGRREESGRG